jgi:hypothetical protein
MADFRSLLYSIDEGGAGSISWQPLQQITSAVAKVHCLPGDLLAALTDRLKSEATYVVLNTLTVRNAVKLSCNHACAARNSHLACSSASHDRVCVWRTWPYAHCRCLVLTVAQRHACLLCANSCRLFTRSASTASSRCMISL